MKTKYIVSIQNTSSSRLCRCCLDTVSIWRIKLSYLILYLCQIRGSRDAVGSSNIRMHDLSFELTSFKALQTLEVSLHGNGSPWQRESIWVSVTDAWRRVDFSNQSSVQTNQPVLENLEST